MLLTLWNLVPQDVDCMLDAFKYFPALTLFMILLYRLRHVILQQLLAALEQLPVHLVIFSKNGSSAVLDACELSGYI